ncbi:hypothetical protein B5S33_g2548 [[Candida] boidinii]|nr:hypothetical protein B5S30_g3372 [[Candida] boidinii]OWB83912.1 hypothetical protein B5S33_g2548 [[Candida] boidinii]GMG05512.1 unnamed protein product [[Candida] boidinii]
MSSVQKYTPLSTIKSEWDTLTNEFKLNGAIPISDRLKLMKKFKTNLSLFKDELCDSLLRDFHRSVQETIVMEYGCVVDEIESFISNLESWLKPETPDFYSAAFVTISAKIEKCPYGVLLICAPFNYPLQLSLVPLVGAICSGNKVVLKLPTDRCPSFCDTLTKLLNETFNDKVLSVVNGSVKETELLLNLKFDKILFTGSTKVGYIVAKAAAKNLTPTILELGGKSPCFITPNHGDLEVTARRCLWGKFANSGQTCVAIDYILAEDSIYDNVVSTFTKVASKLFNGELTENDDFTHIINTDSYTRLLKTISDTKGEIVYGGLGDTKKAASACGSNFIKPTIIKNVKWDDSTMKFENFGPILPILKYSDLKIAVEEVKRNHDTPLALYIFSNDESEQNLIKNSIRSGAVGINEVLMHAGLGSVPFGGIGESGMGYYHGKYSVDSFTFKKPVYKQPFITEALIDVRYPPYSKKKTDRFLLMSKLPSLPAIKLDFVSLVLIGVAFVIGAFSGSFYN